MRKKILIDINYLNQKFAEGSSIPAIAKELEVCDQTVRRRIKEKDEKLYKEFTKTKKERKEDKISKYKKKLSEYRKNINSENLSLPEKSILASKLLSLNKINEMIIEKAKNNKKIDLELTLCIANFIHNKTMGRRSNSVVSACSVYVQSLHQKKKLAISQKEAAEMFITTSITIRKLFKFIKIPAKQINMLILSQQEENVNSQ